MKIRIYTLYIFIYSTKCIFRSQDCLLYVLESLQKSDIKIRKYIFVFLQNFIINQFISISQCKEYIGTIQLDLFQFKMSIFSILVLDLIHRTFKTVFFNHILIKFLYHLLVMIQILILSSKFCNLFINFILRNAWQSLIWGFV